LLKNPQQKDSAMIIPAGDCQLSLTAAVEL
jgi:hypothetical protein